MKTEQQYATFEDWLKRNYKGPYMATDLIIRYNNGIKEGIVLIDRKYNPKGKALPGGLAEKMQFSQNVVKEGKEETGLNVKIDYPHRPFCEFSNPDQDPREFISTICYTGRGYGKLRPDPKEDAKRAFVLTLDELTRLLEKDVWAFPHHKKILEMYVKDEDYRSNLK